MRRNSTILKFEGHRVSDGAPADVLRVRPPVFTRISRQVLVHTSHFLNNS